MVAVTMAVMVMPRVGIVVMALMSAVVVTGVSSGGDAYGMRVVVMALVGVMVVTGVSIVVMLVMRPVVVTGVSIVVMLVMGAVVVTGVSIVVVLVMRPVVVTLVASFRHSFHSLGSVSFIAAPVVAGMRLSLARRSTPRNNLPTSMGRTSPTPAG